MREFKKMFIAVYFIKKHCFPSRPVPVRAGFPKIQVHLKNLGRDYTLLAILFELVNTYTIPNPLVSPTAMCVAVAESEDSDDGLTYLDLDKKFNVIEC